jgi:hypothetical protein
MVLRTKAVAAIALEICASGSILAPDDELEKCQREARSGIYRPDDGNPTHAFCVINCPSLYHRQLDRENA